MCVCVCVGSKGEAGREGGNLTAKTWCLFVFSKKKELLKHLKRAKHNEKKKHIQNKKQTPEKMGNRENKMKTWKNERLCWPSAPRVGQLLSL